MKEFKVVPAIRQYHSCMEFLEEFQIGEGDLVITGGSAYHRFLEGKTNGAKVILRSNYQKGEPSDEMVAKMAYDIGSYDYSRVFAIGGGSVLDLAKLFALEKFLPVQELFEKKYPPMRTKQLILAPTTCGTGSEVTNISILEFKNLHTKMGLAADELFADYAILIPELLDGIPFSVFAPSAIDAFIHAVESYLSPKASAMTEIYSEKAMVMILEGFKKIAEEGQQILPSLLPEFLTASTYAGIGFGNAGTGAVHALSYPLGGIYHVPHGEANYAVFTGVFRMYVKLQPEGKIQRLNQILADILNCSIVNVYDELELLLNHLIVKKPLKEYGMKEEEIDSFTESVLAKQGRLLANNYTELNSEQIRKIYRSLYTV